MEIIVFAAIGSKIAGVVLAVASGISGSLYLLWTRRAAIRSWRRRINEPV